jgi:predicted Mrr-cat superfamily restriction endonuclease
MEGFPMNIFQIKTWPDGERQMVEDFIHDEYIAIGWPGLGDLKNANRQEIKKRLGEALHEAHKDEPEELKIGSESHRLGYFVGQLNTFVNVMQAGDLVMVVEREWGWVGSVGEYEYYDDEASRHSHISHRRSVNWKNRIPLVELNYSIQTFLKNRNIISKFSGTLQDSGLSAYLDGIERGEPTPIKQDRLHSLFEEALTILQTELKSTDPDRRLKAAAALIQLKYR